MIDSDYAEAKSGTAHAGVLATERLRKAQIVLHETIDTVAKRLEYVLRPDNPKAVVGPALDVVHGERSAHVEALDTLVEDIDSEIGRLRRLIDRIDI